TGDFSGWTLTGDTVVGNMTYNAVGTDNSFINVVHEGLFGAFLGEGGTTASLAQTLATIPGQQYRVSFWLDENGDGDVQLFSLYWDGTTLLSRTNSATFAWTNYQYTVTASATNTVLEVIEEDDPGYFGFDEVTVMPVPTLTLSGISCTNNCVQ